MRRILIYLWTFPNTLVGLVFFPLAMMSGGKFQIVEGVLEIYGGLVRGFLRHGTLLRGGAAAMTLGHVVIGLDALTLSRTRCHERIHVRQCERWGPFFIPAYLLASLWLFIAHKHPYLDNPFEKEAYGTERNIR